MEPKGTRDRDTKMNTDNHIPDDDLAALAEGRLAEPRRNEAREHLKHCRACLAGYADAVRYRAHELAGGRLPAVPPELLRRAYAVPGTAPRRATRRPIALHYATALAGLAAVAMILLLAPHREARTARLPLTGEQLAELRAAIEGASLHEMILPGGEAFSGGLQRPCRNGSPESGPLTATAIAELTAAGEAGHLSAEDTAWLVAALAATGRNAEAAVHVRRVRSEQPFDPRWTHLEGVIAYLEGDLASAESLLRDARARRPEDPVIGFNLGYLLAAQGRLAEAQPLLEEVAREAAGSPLAERAAEILRWPH